MSQQQQPPTHPLHGFAQREPDELIQRARAYADELSRRRTVRDYSDRPVPRAVIEQAVRAAGSAPSGANQQPWHFVAIGDPAIKQAIRAAAEEEERAFYAHRAPEDWLDALAPLGTTADKPFLETAPWLIAVFYERHRIGPDGQREKTYYAIDSVGIATGMLIATLHHAGLATLTHTPSPMGFLTEILGRPKHERPFVLLVAGYPAADAQVPAITRRPLPDILTVLSDHSD
ncbi:MAG: nitroreductase family protein [Nevskiales bacterium]|nr:nitroreductase family protein [Nevskiales bacterium]